MEKDEEKEILSLILGKNYENRKSTLQMALSVARLLCCYKSGKTYSYASFLGDRNTVNDNPYDIAWRSSSPEADIFTAMLLYLIGLEQLGTLLTKNDKKESPCNRKGGIYRILEEYYLSECPEEDNEKRKNEIKAIVALRNALAHSFGLFGCSEGENHKFTLKLRSDNSSVSIIELPKKKWTGDFNDKNEETSTIIYPINLIKLIEEIISKIQLKDSRIILDIEETKTRYSIISD